MLDSIAKNLVGIKDSTQTYASSNFENIMLQVLEKYLP